MRERFWKSAIVLTSAELVPIRSSKPFQKSLLTFCVVVHLENVATEVSLSLKPTHIHTHISQISVILPRIQHRQIDQLPHLEVSPYPQLVVRRDLPNGHPFVVRPHGRELPVREARAGGGERAPNRGVVRVCSSGLPGVVRHLVVVPDGDPGPALVREEQTLVRAVLCEALSVVEDCRE